MHLLIDAGNTRVKWASAAASGPAGAWLASGAHAHADIAAFGAPWAALAGQVTQVIVSNVAGPAVRAALAGVLATALPGITPCWFASQAQLAGVRNGYRNPAQLGCDRFAAAIGAHVSFPQQSLIVVMCGTATTIDALDPDGTFAGGLILPGLDLMAQALNTGTAQLPQIDWERVGASAPGFPDNTDDAIAGGCLAAQCGAIETAVARQRARHGATRCILSGGAAPTLAHALCMPYQIVDNLVMTGLQAVLRTAPARPDEKTGRL